MDGIVKHAMAKCPYLSKTPVEQLRKLSTVRVNSVGTNALASLASRKCPMMKDAFQSQSVRGKATLAHSVIENGNSSTTLIKTLERPSGQFSYESFYEEQLEKKKLDRSYRYFNNINRLAHKFPMAHTGTGDHVTVWCSNDYLGMSKHPEVLEAMK